MEVLFATTNPAKIDRYKEKLEKNGIKVLTLKDLNINIEVEETGKTAIENACIKAKAYGDISKKITIGLDTNLFFENVKEEEQPGTHVRRVNGKNLTDEEMIEYYKKLANKYGGKITAKWVNGIAIYNGKETKIYSYDKSKFYLTDRETKNRIPGYPLDSIGVAPEFNKFIADLNKEEIQEREKIKAKNSNESVAEIISELLKNM